MRRLAFMIFLVLAFSPLAGATECGPVPTDGCTITQKTTFQEGPITDSILPSTYSGNVLIFGRIASRLL